MFNCLFTGIDVNLIFYVIDGCISTNTVNDFFHNSKSTYTFIESCMESFIERERALVSCYFRNSMLV